MNWVVRNWLILAALLVGLSLLLSQLSGAPMRVVALVGWGGIALIALVDGIRRMLGKPSLLGAERGAGRILAAIQVLLAVLLLVGLVAPVLAP